MASDANTDVGKVEPLSDRMKENTFQEAASSPPIDDTVAELWIEILKGM